MKNGDLLIAAEPEKFELLVTTDQNLRYQQNLEPRKFAIFVLPFASWPRLRAHVTAIANAIEAMPTSGFVKWRAP